MDWLSDKAIYEELISEIMTLTKKRKDSLEQINEVIIETNLDCQDLDDENE